MYRDLDVLEQDDVEIFVKEKFSLNFQQEGKYSESEFADMANPNNDNAEMGGGI